MSRASCIIALLLCGCSQQPDTKDLEFGKKLVKERLYEQALPHLDKAIAADPKSAVAFQYRAEVYLALKRTKEAKADIDEALRLDPKDAEPLFMWGNVLLFEAYDLHESAIPVVTEAEQYFRKCVEIEPENIRFRKQLDAAINLKRLREKFLVP